MRKGGENLNGSSEEKGGNKEDGDQEEVGTKRPSAAGGGNPPQPVSLHYIENIMIIVTGSCK